MIKTRCPVCDKGYRVAADKLGRVVRCKACDASFEVVDVDAEAAQKSEQPTIIVIERGGRMPSLPQIVGALVSIIVVVGAFLRPLANMAVLMPGDDEPQVAAAERPADARPPAAPPAGAPVGFPALPDPTKMFERLRTRVPAVPAVPAAPPTPPRPAGPPRRSSPPAEEVVTVTFPRTGHDAGEIRRVFAQATGLEHVSVSVSSDTRVAIGPVRDIDHFVRLNRIENARVNHEARVIACDRLADFGVLDLESLKRAAEQRVAFQSVGPVPSGGRQESTWRPSAISRMVSAGHAVDDVTVLHLRCDTELIHWTAVTQLSRDLRDATFATTHYRYERPDGHVLWLAAVGFDEVRGALEKYEVVEEDAARRTLVIRPKY
ncbi:MAG: MJ0042-type zinc finger domain-containing protein [Planctomycetota bacterium]